MELSEQNPRAENYALMLILQKPKKKKHVAGSCGGAFY